MLQKIQKKQNQNQKSIECTLRNEIETKKKKKQNEEQQKERHQMARKNLMNVDYNLLSFLSKYVHAPMSIDG